MSEEKLERNVEIYAKKLRGASYKELKDEYGISEKRIYQIFIHEKIKKLFRNIK